MLTNIDVVLLSTSVLHALFGLQHSISAAWYSESPVPDIFLHAGHSSKLRLLGISTVAGNQTVDKVTLNALGVVEAAGLQHISM